MTTNFSKTNSLQIIDCTGGTTGQLMMDPELECPLKDNIGMVLLSVSVLVFYIVLPYSWFIQKSIQSSKELGQRYQSLTICLTHRAIEKQHRVTMDYMLWDLQTIKIEREEFLYRAKRQKTEQ